MGLPLRLLSVCNLFRNNFLFAPCKKYHLILSRGQLNFHGDIMNKKENDFAALSDQIFEFVSGLLENDYEPPAICIALASHAARLGLQSEVDATKVVGNLFLPIVHQLMDQSNFEEDEGVEDEDETNKRITHKCAVLH